MHSERIESDDKRWRERILWDREEVIWVEEAQCHRCRQIKRCFMVDPSFGEYASGDMCLECIKRFFDEAERLQ